ncbi:MAG: hypothetical protein AAFO07_17620 [Bacteroidota bacterium]
MKNRFLFFILFAFFLVSCSSSKKSNTGTTDMVSESSALSNSVNEMNLEAILGIWDITINTPRGQNAGVLTIYQEDNELRGQTENADFKIKQKGNKLSWSSTFDTPRGAMNALNNVSIEDGILTGTVSIAGRSLNISGKKRE